MAGRLIIFDINSLLKLLAHYTDGAVDLDAEAVSFDFSPRLPRYISLMVTSKAWSDEQVDPMTKELQPFNIRYEGRRVLKLNDLRDQPEWSPEGYVEAPKQQ